MNLENQEANQTQEDLQPTGEASDTKSNPNFFKSLKTNGKQFYEKLIEIWSVYKGRIKAKNQILIFIALVIVVLFWGLISSLLQSLSGVIEVDITSKHISEYCYELVDTNGRAYCVDEASYNYVNSADKYKLIEMEYTFKVRR